MKIYSYSPALFSIKDENGIVSQINPSPKQQVILNELFACDQEKWENNQYSVHSLLHSMPSYEKGIGGHAYSKLIEEWAKDKPQVKSFRFDDRMFMGSVGFLVPSMNKWEHMGINVILCPQCEDIFEFFCYPSHLESLLQAFGVSQELLLSVPARDYSSPLFLKREQLKTQLLESCQNEN
jgi:hypothetical protein